MQSPLVFISEYSFKTQKQILYTGKGNFLRKLRSLLWLNRLEGRVRKAVKEADGLQCNGTPTYDAYRTLNRNSMLFFDSRVTSSLLQTHDELGARLNTLSTTRPLRLAFSGRLIKIKGVDQLIPMACTLKNLGINFHLDICGEGELLETLQEQITSYGLNSFLKVKGKLDFKTQLIPFMKSQIDLFVCPHVQGDPACTYLEIMSCGVPIAGYDNEALEGLSKYSKTGWTSPLGQPEALAQKIIYLSKNRDLIKEDSYASLKFASNHTFEQTFKRRVEHFLEVCKTKGS